MNVAFTPAVVVYPVYIYICTGFLSIYSMVFKTCIKTKLHNLFANWLFTFLNSYSYVMILKT